MKILVRPNAKRGSDVYHLPNEDGNGPKCGTDGPRNKEWVEKDDSMFPNARVCQKCEKGAGPEGPYGSQSAAKLSELDPEEVGL